MRFSVLLGLCLLVVLYLSRVTQLQAANILVIESYHAAHPWVISNTQGLNSRLSSDEQLHFFYLNAKSLTPSQLTAQAELAWQTYQRLKPRLVILSDDNAIDLLAKRIASAGTPVVYLGMNGNPRQGGLYGLNNITGVLERPLIKRNITEMSQLLGSPQKALVLFDDSEVSRITLSETFRGADSWRIGNLQVDVKQSNEYNKWQQSISQAKAQGYALIFIGLYHTLRNPAGEPVDAEQALAWANGATSVPLFALWDFSVGAGKCVGGLVMSGYEQGSAAGELALQILQSDAPKSLTPRTAARGEYLFSRQEMARWQLTLPPKLDTPKSGVIKRNLVPACGEWPNKKTPSTDGVFVQRLT